MYYTTTTPPPAYILKIGVVLSPRIVPYFAGRRIMFLKSASEWSP